MSAGKSSWQWEKHGRAAQIVPSWLKLAPIWPKFDPPGSLWGRLWPLGPLLAPLGLFLGRSWAALGGGGGGGGGRGCVVVVVTVFAQKRCIPKTSDLDN